MKKCLIAAAAACAIASGPAAQAQWTVIDPTNLVQNMLTALNTLEQISNQTRQLQNEAQMLMNQARNLERIDYNALSRLQVAIAAVNRLLDEAQGLTFDLEQAQAEYARLYPDAYGDAVSRDRLNADVQERWAYSHEALRTTMQVQAQAAENFSEDAAVLADVVGRSHSAAGALQALQATNQLLALQTRQLMQAQQLQITQDRAVALEAARAVAAQERARVTRNRFMSDETRYAGEPVQAYRE
jgi:type IV secretion system protein TrbJ